MTVASVANEPSVGPRVTSARPSLYEVTVTLPFRLTDLVTFAVPGSYSVVAVRPAASVEAVARNVDG